MNSHFQLPYQKLKAAILLLSLGLLMVGSCPIQKILISAFSIGTEVAKQPSTTTLVKNTLRCADYKEVVNAPLVEQSKQRDGSNALLLDLVSPLIYGVMPSGGKDLGAEGRPKAAIDTGIPLFLRNQVFRI